MYKELLYGGGGRIKKKGGEVMHPRKEGWSGRACDPSPNSPGATSSLPRGPPSCPPTDHASQQVPGRPRQGGRESAARFGLEGESHRSVKAKGGEWGPRIPSGSPQTACSHLSPSWAAWYQLEPVSRPPNRGLCDPRGPAWSQGLKTAWEADRGGIPHWPLGTLRSRNERKRRVLVTQGGALLTLRPPPGCHGPKPSALWVSNRRTYAVTIRRLLLRQWPV